MRIMFNTMGLGKGGAERVINLLSNSFCLENDVMIVTNIKTVPEYNFDDRIIIKSLVKNSNNFLRKFRRISILILLKLRKITLTYKPDVIISFLPEPSFRILLLKKLSKKIKDIPIIVSVRNDPNREYNNQIFFYIMKKLYPYANQLVLQTEDSKKYFIEKIGYNGVVIPNPVADVFLTERYDGNREKRIVAVGRLEPQKNYKNMIDAFEIVSKKHDDYTFEIFGDGYLKSELQDYINSKRLHNKIFLMGKTDNVKKAIYKATVFVMSSDYEGMPNSLLEAACLGIPCVSTDCPCGGPREILENGKSGILVEINNSQKLAEGIIKIVENEKIANKFGINTNKNQINYKTDLIVSKWFEEVKCLVIDK